MGFKFNPFSGNFDQTGSGGGGGASYIDGEVATYNDLPLDGTAALNSAWLVREASGIWPVSRKQAGIYIRTATAGSSRDADYTYAGTMPDVFSDAVFTLYDEASTTRTGQFNLGSITAGQNRVLTWPDGNGTIARTSDIPSTFAASAITSGVFDNARINFAAPSAIGSTTAAAITGTTGTFSTLNANNGTLTASAPALSVGQTWNASGTTFRTLDIDVTNTASASGSLFLRARLGTAIRFVVGAANGGGGTSRVLAGEFQAGISDVDGTGTGAMLSTFGIRARSDGNIGFVSGADTTVGNDVTLVRDAADTLAQRRTTNPQTFRLYNTFTDASNHERGFMRWSSNNFEIGTEAAGTGTVRETRIVVGAATYRFASNSNAIFSGTLNIAATAEYQWFNRSIMSSSASGIILLTNSARDDWSRLQFGGTTSSFPALKRSSTALQVRLADDSAFADFECGGSTFNSLMIIRNSSLLMLNGGSIRLQTSAGADTAEIARDAAGIVALRSGTTAHSFRVYNTSTSSNANFERANFRWAANEFIIDAEAGGTGTSLRGIKIGSATSSLLGFYGATPVDRPATVADPTGGGTIDTEARTAINDIIDRLQELGLIA